MTQITREQEAKSAAESYYQRLRTQGDILGAALREIFPSDEHGRAIFPPEPWKYAERDLAFDFSQPPEDQIGVKFVVSKGHIGVKGSLMQRRHLVGHIQQITEGPFKGEYQSWGAELVVGFWNNWALIVGCGGYPARAGLTEYEGRPAHWIDTDHVSDLAVARFLEVIRTKTVGVAQTSMLLGYYDGYLPQAAPQDLKNK